MTQVLKTPLYERHKALGAKMSPFAGYEMPIEYEGILKEHEAVRNLVGLFDVSHMGEIEIRGKRAIDFCQKVSTNDVSALKPGKIQYTTILNEQGGIIDDCTLYRLSEESFLYVVNASRRQEVLGWFEKHKIDHSEIQDKSDEFGLLALQGKKANSLLSQLVKRDLDTVAYYEFIWTELLGTAVLISRTGYTGEDGFEIYISSKKVVEAWDLVLSEGKTAGIMPVGLGARDTLRLEMGYLLYGNDMKEDTTPLEAGISWAVKLEKGHFIGRDALLQQKEKGIRRRLRGIKMKGRAIPRSHYELTDGSKKIGEVTSGTYSPTLKQGIALGYIEPTFKNGDEIFVTVRGKAQSAEIVKPPFVVGSIKR